MKGYDEYNTILLPPRNAGDDLPKELNEAYNEMTKKKEDGAGKDGSKPEGENEANEKNENEEETVDNDDNDVDRKLEDTPSEDEAETEQDAGMNDLNLHFL